MNIQPTMEDQLRDASSAAASPDVLHFLFQRTRQLLDLSYRDLFGKSSKAEVEYFNVYVLAHPIANAGVLKSLRNQARNDNEKSSTAQVC